MAKKKMKKTKLTRSQVYKNDNILDEIHHWLYMCGSDCLFAGEFNAKESEKEWNGYIKNVKRIKSLANKLQIKKSNKPQIKK